jgi:hypothetical protein
MFLRSPLYHTPKAKAKDCAKNLHESEVDLSGISYNPRGGARCCANIKTRYNWIDEND